MPRDARRKRGCGDALESAVRRWSPNVLCGRVRHLGGENRRPAPAVDDGLRSLLEQRALGLLFVDWMLLHGNRRLKCLRPFQALSQSKIRQMRIPLFHVNAFTNRPFSGNPAAVCPLQSWLDDGLMRKVAAENNLSETAFFVSVGDRYDLRWSTARGEVKLCGHATLASAYMILTRLEPKLDSVRFETRHS